MNREIKFRAFIDRKKTNYPKDIIYWTVNDDPPGLHNIIDNSISQFIGLKDKSGKEIYDRDIISWGGNDKPAVIQWSDTYSSFGLKCEGWMFLHFFGEAVDPSDCEVIGNIYQNSELLKPLEA